MAFPTIPTVAAGRVLFANQVDTSGTRTFPAFSGLTYSNGDLLLAVVTTYQSTTNPQFSSWSNGFTELSAGGDQGSSTTMGIGIAYKIANGTESGSLSVTQAATITGHASLCLMAIPGAHATTAPEAGTIANGTSAAADPGAFNPAGWGTEDTLWVSVVASGMTSGTGSWTKTGTTAPANYSNWANSNKTDNSTVGEVEIGVSFRQLNATSENVGTAGVDLSNARNSALVIAVRPAPSNHAATGALTGPGSTVSGSASSATTRSSSGTLTGQGATLSGTAERAGGTVTHAATGTLTGPGATLSGSASSATTRAATGVLTGQGSTLSGSAARTGATITHASTGTLTGQGSTAAGSATHFHAFATSGVLTGQGSTVVGSATRTAPAVTHSTSGTLTGGAAVLSGAASSATVRASSGVLVGQIGGVSGVSARAHLHEAAGGLVGAGATLAASAQRDHFFETEGTLIGGPSSVSGAALLAKAHDATGALTGGGSAVAGAGVHLGNISTVIYQLLANRQELDPVAGTFTVYADDGVTPLFRASAWADAAGTTPYTGRDLRRIDRLEPVV